MRLNKSKPYGIVYGHSVIAFEQDGQQFGPQGESIDWNALQADVEEHTQTSLDRASAAIDKAKLTRSEAIKAGIARARRQAEQPVDGI